MAERIGDRVNAGMRALGSAVGKSIGQAAQNQGQVVTSADTEKLNSALLEIAHAIDRLAEAVRKLKP